MSKLTAVVIGECILLFSSEPFMLLSLSKYKRQKFYMVVKLDLTLVEEGRFRVLENSAEKNIWN
jgi:hypothetical protein